MLNFGSLQNVQPANTISYLKAYDIHQNVVIKSVEIKEGTSENGNDWKSLNITFGNDGGIYNHSIFWITSDKDFERKVLDMPNGGKKELPSNWERTRDVMAAIGYTYFPDTFKKIQSIASKAKTFDDIVSVFKKALEANIGKNPTSMKLVGRNSNGRVYATLPNCTGIAQAKDEKKAAANGVEVGEWYTWMINPFGNNLSFSDYEKQKADEYHNAKPTPVDNSNVITDSVNNFETNKSEENIDFDDLLGSL